MNDLLLDNSAIYIRQGLFVLSDCLLLDKGCDIGLLLLLLKRNYSSVIIISIKCITTVKKSPA